MEPAYDSKGRGYERFRRADPRLERAILRALDDARSVVNVGAGTGSYEPRDRWVLAVEPSEVMIAQRPRGAAPAIKAPAEQLPLADRSVDAAMAILTIQHWDDVEAGLVELLRVIRDRIVVVTMDTSQLAELWIVRDYFPELLGDHARRFPSIKWLSSLLPCADVEVLPVPHDCEDMFMAALWARPEALLDPAIRAATSPWYDLPSGLVGERLARLAADLHSGAWSRRYRDLLGFSELDVGLRLVTSSK
jgi:SAM-dependent methyltransferase